MKRAVAISFLFIFLFANTELKQLLKLPFLVHHYMEHKEEDASKSLLAFLHEHYAEEHGASNASHHHEKLPFKSHHTCISQTPVFCSITAGFDCNIETVLPVTVKDYYTESSHYPSAVSKIWQPPRAC